MNLYLLVGGLAVLILVALVVTLVVPQVRSRQRRKALEPIVERYHQSRQALVRYVMLNHQCSEEVAYQRLAAFMKKHVPLDDHYFIDRMLAQDRQRLLDKAQSLLADDPDEIDKI